MSDWHHDHPPIIPTRKTGLNHLLASTSYSIAGGRRLLRETAARHELALAICGFVSLVMAGGSGLEVLVFLAMVALLFAAEAMNTAIEILTDHVSPEWSEAAKQAKDLGSLACAFLIMIVIGGWGYMILS